MVRLAAKVTRKSLPCEASTAIVGPSVNATTAGASALGSTVVAALDANAGEANASVSIVPATPTAATPAARLKTFLRLSAWPETGI